MWRQTPARVEEQPGERRQRKRERQDCSVRLEIEEDRARPGFYQSGNRSSSKRAMANPRAPPIKASNMLSVRNCRTGRARPAPIDRRIVTSLTRAVPRAKKVGDVRAPDQEHQPDHRHQHVQRQRVHDRAGRCRGRRESDARTVSHPGSLRSQTLGGSEKLLERGIDRSAARFDAGPDAGHDRHVAQPRLVIGQQARCVERPHGKRERDVDARRIEPAKAGGRDAHD